MKHPLLQPDGDRLGAKLLGHPVTHWLVGFLILAADLATGPFLMFPILFVVPILLSGWYGRLRTCLALAVMLPLGRAVIATFVEASQPLGFILANAATRIVVLLLLGYFVARTARYARGLERQVQTLTGLLPTCMHCKKIRDPENRWHPIETYISKRSEATFSHGICPECLKKHHTDFGV
ncbi:MAG: hypothetical protein IT580_03190 [Verrucomicrobiales bacterium]|nr:hypothetical protein [Verrucomicrobiales bacterium]